MDRPNLWPPCAQRRVAEENAKGGLRAARPLTTAGKGPFQAWLDDY